MIDMQQSFFIGSFFEFLLKISKFQINCNDINFAKI